MAFQFLLKNWNAAKRFEKRKEGDREKREKISLKFFLLSPRLRINPDWEPCLIVYKQPLCCYSFPADCFRIAAFRRS